jgi:hypothetical protein
VHIISIWSKPAPQCVSVEYAHMVGCMHDMEDNKLTEVFLPKFEKCSPKKITSLYMARSTNKQQAASQSVAQSLAHSSFHYPNTTPTCCIDKQINAIVAYHQLPAYKYYIRDHNKVNHYIFPCIIVN